MNESRATPPPVTGEPAPPLLGLSRERLAEVLGPWIDRPFRIQQVYEALHQRGISDFDEITNLSKTLRGELASRFRIGLPEVADRRLSDDGTVKFLLRLDDGASIEAVDIPEAKRTTLCISSQAGCALGCTFCVTGFWGAGRNLTAGEIVAQVLIARRDWEEHGKRVERLNLVFMGMGEPLLNLEGLEGALDILTEDLSWRRITVSTAGVIPGIEALAKWPKRPNLAISLHAPDDERRNEIMPINKTYPLKDLLAALRRFPLEKGRRITFEYILIKGLNDAVKDAERLAKLLKPLQSKVNLIPINPDPVLGDHMVPPANKTIEAFKKRLMSRGLIATVRQRRGDQVSAACGQLRAFEREPHGALARKRKA